MGWSSQNYPFYATTVTTTPLLSPIPGPMPYSYKFAKVDIAYGRCHMEATPSQGQSPLPPNSPSLPAPLDGIQNLPSRRRAITARAHTGTEDTCRILPGRPLSSTATTILAAHCFLPANNKEETASDEDSDGYYNNNKGGDGGR